MKVIVSAFLALMVCACLVQVQAGLSDLFGGGHDDKEAGKDHKRQSKYQGGIGHQVAHTLVDGGLDRLVDMGEQKFDNPLMDAALVGIGHKLKSKVHDKINEFQREDGVEGDGERKKEGGRFGGLFRRRRAITEAMQKAAVAGVKAAGKHMMNNALGLGGSESDKKEADKKSGGSTLSNMMESAKSLVGVGSTPKEEPKKEEEKKDEKKEEAKKEEPKKEESKKEDEKKEEPEKKGEDEKKEKKE